MAASVQSGPRGYDILELVGTGGMADIFLAVQQGEEGFRKKVILKKIRSSVGASLLWASPLGPIRFDYAYVLSKEKYDQEQAFRFSGGGSF